MYTLRQIRYFLAVAETGQVSAAASELHISQSAITVAIKDLEKILGVALLERRVGGMALTNDGQRFLAYARDIEATTAGALHSMRKAEPTINGCIRLGATYTGVGYFLMPVLARFCRSYPTVTVKLTEFKQASLELAIRNGEIDLGLIVSSNARETRNLKLERRVLIRSPRGLWLSSAHPLMRAGSISLADIANEPYVQFTADEAERSARAYWGRYGLKPNVVFETESMEAVRGMVATGAAITVLAKFAHRPWSIDGGRVEFRTLKDPIPTFDLGLVWRARRPLSAAERAFIARLETAAKLGPHR